MQTNKEIETNDFSRNSQPDAAHKKRGVFRRPMTMRVRMLLSFGVFILVVIGAIWLFQTFFMDSMILASSPPEATLLMGFGASPALADI